MNATEGIWYGKTLTRRMPQVADETERLNRIKAPYVKQGSLDLGEEDAEHTIWL